MNNDILKQYNHIRDTRAPNHIVLDPNHVLQFLSNKDIINIIQTIINKHDTKLVVEKIMKQEFDAAFITNTNFKDSSEL
jgi:hypothetical protein